jgi:hypothetical protein
METKWQVVRETIIALQQKMTDGKYFIHIFESQDTGLIFIISGQND